MILLHGKKVLIGDKICLLHGGAAPENGGAGLLHGKIVLIGDKIGLLHGGAVPEND